MNVGCSFIVQVWIVQHRPEDFLHPCRAGFGVGHYHHITRSKLFWRQKNNNEYSEISRRHLLSLNYIRTKYSFIFFIPQQIPQHIMYDGITINWNNIVIQSYIFKVTLAKRKAYLEIKYFLLELEVSPWNNHTTWL